MSTKKKLAVCGCSFMWSSCNSYNLIKGPDWPSEFVINQDELTKSILDECVDHKYQHWPHFTDMYSKEKNFEVLNFAEGGASNFGIRLQIDKAIDANVDYIVIGGTMPDRFEIPLPNKSEFEYSAKIDNYKKQLDPLIFDAVKYRFLLQNKYLDNQKSYYFLQGGLYRLTRSNIPYVFIPGPMKHDIDWQEFDIVWPDNMMSPWDYKNRLPLGNHIPIEGQYEFFKLLSNLTPHWQ
jgi:hypothetical protein